MLDNRLEEIKAYYEVDGPGFVGHDIHYLVARLEAAEELALALDVFKDNPDLTNIRRLTTARAVWQQLVKEAQRG